MRDIVVGDSVDQYRVVELLARSGMASVFKGIDTASGLVVALKIPHVQYESDVVFFERFRREEDILARLDHPNVVRAVPPRDKSRVYIAMEYVEGTSVRAMMRQGRSLPMDRALYIARQTCDTLAYLHREGVVHRDVKPENVLLTSTGQVKLLDFGIARSQSARRLTWMGLSSKLGTPDYMAPEQVRGGRGDARTDLYGLGTMLYEMVTGHLPYDAPDARGLLRAKAARTATPPSEYVPGLDPAVEAIVMRAIEREPRNRYQDAATMLSHLREPSLVPLHDVSAPMRNRRGNGSRHRRLVVGAALTAVLAGLGSLVWLTDHQHAAPRAPVAQQLGTRK